MSTPPPGQSAGRYPRSARGMIGAMLAVVLGVVAYVGIGSLLSDNRATPVPTVGYSGWAKSGREDGKLLVLTPSPMPRGWRATSAGYTPGMDPRWHLGMLTGSGRYVGLEERWAPPGPMVREYVDPHATRHGTARVGGRTWQVWTDHGGDYALVSSRPSRARHHRETVLVVGDAPPAAIRSFAASLTAG